MGHVNKAVIPVAGMGTRGLPFTKEVPKELLPVIDTPTIQFIVEEIVEAGIEQIVLVTAKGKSAIEDFFDPSPQLEQLLESRGKYELLEKVRAVSSLCDVITVRQKAPLGLGHAVLCAQSVIGNEKFVVCLGDQIFPKWQPKAPATTALASMVELAKHGQSVVGVVEIVREKSGSYGIIDIGDQSMGSGLVQVGRTVEKPAPEDAPSGYAVVGRYVFEPQIFGELEKTKPGVGGEIQLTDAMNSLAKEGKLSAYLVSPEGYDMGNQFAFIQAQIEWALQRPALSSQLRELLERL